MILVKDFYWFVFCHLIVSLLVKESLAGDTLIPDQSIRDNQTLTSSGQVFELGFFSPGNPNFRYLGIWYKDIPSSPVVWVANRLTPITDASGVLTISQNGNLFLLNGNGSIIWRTNSTNQAKNAVAQILDNGNLVVREMVDSAKRRYLWQSFDYPTDTLLPGMKQGRDLRTGLNRVLTSWRSSEDPAPGDYSYGMDLHDGLPQLVLRMGAKELFRSGFWYDNRFSGGPLVEPNSLFNPIMVVNSDEVYYTYESVDNNTLQRTSVSPSGLGQHFTWNRKQLQWLPLYALQKDHCDNYNQCGAFGVCDMNVTPNCKCMIGFTPKSPQEWKLFEKSGGCIRKSPLECQEGNKFRKYNSVKLPDTPDLRINFSMNAEKCKETCLKSCSCTGYTVMDTGGDGKGCLAWFGELIDFRITRTDYGQEFYLKISASEDEPNADPQKTKKRSILAIALSVSFVAFLLVLGFIIRIRAERKQKRRKKLHGEDWEEELELPIYDLAAIANATNQFSIQNKIGEGGFGTVYKGVLPTGQEVAIKRLSTNSRQGLNELKNEVLLISKLQHRNLVKLLGCCIHQGDMMIVYEFMENRSLDAFIFDEARSRCLGWRSRFKIIEGIARGLLYLHQDSRLRIIHRDLKASNILLDDEMNPKISDFGMARTFDQDQAEAKTRNVVGTYGYMSPEYAVFGVFSMKSDIFSFGVLVLEIVSGRKNNRFTHPEHGMSLLGHAWKLWHEGNILELLDKSMGNDISVNEVARCVQIGLLCVQQLPNDRPMMSSVKKMLDGEDSALPRPNKPGFFVDRCVDSADSSLTKKYSGAKEVTVTLLDGR